MRRPRRASPKGLSGASSSAVAPNRARSRPWRSETRSRPRRRCHRQRSIPVPRGAEGPLDAPGPETATNLRGQRNRSKLVFMATVRDH